MAIASASIDGNSVRGLVNVAFFIGEKGGIARISGDVWVSLAFFWLCPFSFGKGLYGILRHNILEPETMSAEQKNGEIRWQVIKAMLDEFPTLREKTIKYLKKQNPK